MNNQLRRSWRWLQTHLEITYLIAVVLIVVGALLFFTARSVAWLQSIGGAFLGTGFTILITTIIGKQAIHEQYAKEANLRRKDEIYGPLYIELKNLREILQKVCDEGSTYPQRIMIGYSAFTGDPLMSPRYPVPLLIKWSTFKQGYYRNDFTESARHVLDHLIDLAEAYNQAVSKVPDATIEVLSSEIESAIQQTKASDEYLAWQEKLKNYPTERIYNMALRQGGTQPPWFQRLNAVPPVDETLGRAWARSWITSWPSLHEPVTIGLLLAGDASAAARVIHAGYQPEGDPAPLIQWIEEIFQRAMPKLEALTSYREAHAACDRLYAIVREAEQMLLSALNDIQRRYEGGRPPL